MTETKTIEGYTIHEETRTQTVVVNPNDTQELTFYNDPVGGVEIIKVDEQTRPNGWPTPPLKSARWMMPGGHRDYRPEWPGCFSPWRMELTMLWKLKPRSYKLDDTPYYFEVKNGKTSQLTISTPACPVS